MTQVMPSHSGVLKLCSLSHYLSALKLSASGNQQAPMRFSHSPTSARCSSFSTPRTFRDTWSLRACCACAQHYSSGRASCKCTITNPSILKGVLRCARKSARLVVAFNKLSILNSRRLSRIYTRSQVGNSFVISQIALP